MTPGPRPGVTVCMARSGSIGAESGVRRGVNMMHNHEQDSDPGVPATPFDEATDLIDEGDTEADMVQVDRLRMPPLKTMLILGAILVSPIFGLVFGLNFSLGVLAFAMTITTWMAWEGSKGLVPAQRAQLRKAAMLNGLVAVLVVVLLVVRLSV